MPPVTRHQCDATHSAAAERATIERQLVDVIAFWPDMLAPSHLVVEGGLLLHHHWYIPAQTIAAYVPASNGDPGLVTLTMTRGEITPAGWNQPPPGAPSVDELLGE